MNNLENVPETVAETYTKKSSINKLGFLFNNLWPDNGASQSINAIDGLRAIAVLLTMLDHILWSMTIWVPGRFGGITTKDVTIFNNTSLFQDLGGTGVELFFVISGFLLFLPYARTLINAEKFPSTKKFYKKRALRILPAYWISLIIIVFSVGPLTSQPTEWSDFVLHFFLIHDLNSATRESINSPYWTMAVESHFYLLLPPFAWLLYKAKTKLRIILLIFFVLTSPFFGVIQSYINHQPTSFLSHLEIFDVFAYLCVFIAGMLASLLYVKTTNTQLQPNTIRKIKLISKILGVFGLVSLLSYMLILHSITIPFLTNFLAKYPLLIRELVLAISYTSILIGTLMGWTWWSKLLSSPILRFVGVISYSLYIWNIIFYVFVIGPLLVSISSKSLAFLLYCVLTVVILLPFTFLFYSLTERPFIKFRRS